MLYYNSVADLYHVWFPDLDHGRSPDPKSILAPNSFKILRCIKIPLKYISYIMLYIHIYYTRFSDLDLYHGSSLNQDPSALDPEPDSTVYRDPSRTYLRVTKTCQTSNRTPI